MTSPVILLLAGEPSGDLHGAELARALRERWPDCRLLGTGGERMAAEGVQLMAAVDEMAVMGFVEVLGRLPYLLRLARRLQRTLHEAHVDLVIPIDYPGFNLRFAERARRAGVPVVYYIAPQVWAWKPGRAARLARTADRVAVILPFEEELFASAGATASFVGHPLLDRKDTVPSRAAFCSAHGLDPDRPILALFPGSRKQEVERHLAPFLEAAVHLARTRPELQIAIGKAESLSIPLGSRQLGSREDVTVVDDGRALLRHARAALVKSGTTTLEAALEGVPFAVAYLTHPLTFWLARRIVQVDHVALANLVARSRVVPELLQDDVTPERLAEVLGPLLDDTEERQRVLSGLATVRERLGAPGAARRVVDLAADVLRERQLKASTRIDP